MPEQKSHREIHEAVKKHYADAIVKHSRSHGGAENVSAQSGAVRHGHKSNSCCAQTESGRLPEGVASFGCGTPLNFADLKEGQVVVDLGSGAGADLILAARRVGSSGKAIGLDMTKEMLKACEDNLTRAGIKNAEVKMGLMEAMPIEDSIADWIISNCVINLSPDKAKVFSEAFRVLKPGGKLLVSDIVAQDLPEEIRNDILAWAGCIAGAVSQTEYADMLEKAGFINVDVVDKQIYDPEMLKDSSKNCCCQEKDKSVTGLKGLAKFEGEIASVRIYAEKPPKSK